MDARGWWPRRVCVIFKVPHSCCAEITPSSRSAGKGKQGAPPRCNGSATQWYATAQSVSHSVPLCQYNNNQPITTSASLHPSSFDSLYTRSPSLLRSRPSDRASTCWRNNSWRISRRPTGEYSYTYFPLPFPNHLHLSAILQPTRHFGNTHLPYDHLRASPHPSTCSTYPASPPPLDHAPTRSPYNSISNPSLPRRSARPLVPFVLVLALVHVLVLYPHHRVSALVLLATLGEL